MKLSYPAFLSRTPCFELFCSFSESSPMSYIHLLAGSRVQFSVFDFDIFTYVECMNIVNI